MTAAQIILLAGGLRVGDQLLTGKSPTADWKAVVATVLAGGLFALGESAFGAPVVMLAWLVLVSSLVVGGNKSVASDLAGWAGGK